MTNGNRRIKQIKKSEKQGKSEIKEQKTVKKENKMIIAIETMISVFAAIIAFASLLVQRQYAELEYKYKLEPEIVLDGKMGVSVHRNEAGESEYSASVGVFEVTILQKNNLQSAYLIHDDYVVEELQLEEIEGVLEADLNERVDFSEPSITVNGVSYHYEFLLLEGIDDSYELFVIYLRSKNTDGRIVYEALSGIEVLELEKAHADDESYAGERMIAEKYMEMLEECEKYIY